MFKWFRNCKTAEEGRTLYRDLSRKYHPDNGWKGEELKDITSEFKIWWGEYKNKHDSNTTEQQAKQASASNIDYFINIINKLSTLDGIEIDLVGAWLWIRGNTYHYKDYLKQCGCRWSAKHKLWYWTEMPYSRVHTKSTYEELKSFWGCETVTLKHDGVYIGG